MTPHTPALHVALGEPTGRRASPDLWGIFLEDINDALDGGLNADAVQNGQFEYSPADRPGWGPLTAWTARGSVTVRSADPVHPATATHVRLHGGRSTASITNHGYDGMTLGAGPHLLELAVRRVDEAAASLTVRLTSGDREVARASLALGSPAQQWTFLQERIELPADVEDAALALELSQGTVDLDVVSLRPIDPRTGRPRTFRPDLVAALADLKPSFVRFPGGCVAHGLGLENMYHWKTTLGPRHERRHMRNTWGYHQSMSIGYLEYFLLCEQLGASPMPIVPAGVCCQNLPGGPRAVTQDEMPGYIRDVLDLVEFANGGGETRWGAVRTALGHPEPFGLRYLGVGNEDQITADFRDRFHQIHAALRAEHPEITVIGTAGPNPFGTDFEDGWTFAREEDVAIVDEHGYRTPHWFHQNTRRFDGYDRSGPAVYVGEYAARTSRLRSALAEAAGMIGMERNADVVRLASYAPLLARVGHTQWTPDLIYFTPTEVRPSASYHVQRMFSHARGELVCGLEVTGAAAEIRGVPDARSVRLRSPGTRMRWSELTVDGTSHPDQVTTADGEEIELPGWGSDSCEVSVELTRIEGTEGAELHLGGPAGTTHYTVHLGGWQNRTSVVARSDDGVGDEIDGPSPLRGFATGVPRHVRVRAELVAGSVRLRVWVDGELAHDVQDRDDPDELVVVGAMAREDGTRILKIVNATAEERPLGITTPWDGPVTATAEILAGPDPDDGAPFEAWPHPIRVERLRGSSRLETAVPPWSFSVVTLPAP